MPDVFQYYTRFASARGGLGGLPFWARGIVAIFALPGIVLLGLSLLAGLGSIFVLLLLTVPVYRVLQGIVGGRRPANGPEISVNPFVSSVSSLFGQVSGSGVESVDLTGESPGRKQVDAKISDAQ
jgi:hypothetical protein